MRYRPWHGGACWSAAAFSRQASGSQESLGGMLMEWLSLLAPTSVGLSKLPQLYQLVAVLGQDSFCIFQWCGAHSNRQTVLRACVYVHVRGVRVHVCQLLPWFLRQCLSLGPGACSFDEACCLGSCKELPLSVSSVLRL